MGRWSCGLRYFLLLAAIAFIYTQVRLFTTQSEYADKVAAAVEAENSCTSQMRLLIDQISMQKEKVVVLEEKVKRQEQECEQLRTLVQNLERKGVEGLIQQVQVPVAAVVIMACNRADYLERTIKSILKYHGSVASKFPVFVSQDGSNSEVRTKALSYDQLTYMQHLDYEPVHTERPGELIAYYKIARHYKWALDQLFYKHNFNRVIILEDDMEIAPDFFGFFEAGADLLVKDKQVFSMNLYDICYITFFENSLSMLRNSEYCNSSCLNHGRSIMAISSWNDNGQKQFVHDPYILYRSDFFPGLGWMLSKSTWDELSPKWPQAYWDDWLRLKENHRGRQFIRPEVCRTYNFGEHGSSLGQFFQQYLKLIRLNDVPVDWKSMNLSYLMEDKFVKHFADMVKAAKPLYGTDLVLKTNHVDGDVSIQYRDQPDFEDIARQFGIFEEWKDGIPRTAYKGVVVFRYQTTRLIFLVGPDSLQQLGIQNKISIR